MTYDENMDYMTMCEVYKAEAEALRKALKSEKGDWSDKGEKVNVNTDRTESTIELINQIEELKNAIAVKNKYIESLEAKISRLKNEL